MTIHLLTGEDETIMRTVVSDLVHELVGTGDRSLMVDELDGEEYEVRSIVDAAQTPPFLTESRIVVGRGIGRFGVEQLAPLLGYLADPLSSTALVLVGGGGRISKALVDAVTEAGGEVRDTSPPTRAREREAWIDRAAHGMGIRLARPVVALIAERLGEDVGRLDGILHTLSSTYGTARQLTVADVEPFLGEAGGVPPWELTDAIDGGSTAVALALLARMTGAGGRHPLQIMAILHNHYTRLARLDGIEARTEAEAAAALGIRPGYPARKALQQYGRLGGGGVQRAFELLAQADLDVRGAKELPDDLVMEILVARLSRLRR